MPREGCARPISDPDPRPLAAAVTDGIGCLTRRGRWLRIGEHAVCNPKGCAQRDPEPPRRSRGRRPPESHCAVKYRRRRLTRRRRETMPNQAMARRGKSRQVEIDFGPKRGGRRSGAGRERVAPRPRVPHRRRPRLASRFPVHVTVRLVAGMPRLRGRGPAKVLKHAFVHGCDQGTFRICQFSVQGNHIHLICEASDELALARGIQGWKVRVARRLNRLWCRRGTLFDDRYHSVILTTPRQTRHALVYVLHNARRHGEAVATVDIYSSAWYFDGWRTNEWRRGLDPPDNPDGPPAAPAQSWLLAIGWRLRGGGWIDPAELPPAAIASSSASRRRVRRSRRREAWRCAR
jgi:putative transposase